MKFGDEPEDSSRRRDRKSIMHSFRTAMLTKQWNSRDLVVARGPRRKIGIER